MNELLNNEPQKEHREQPTQTKEWDELPSPLKLQSADEGAAFFYDDQGKGWYLSLNEMQYRPLLKSDLKVDRSGGYMPIEIEEGTAYSDGAEAALRVREKHLEGQIEALKMLRKEGTDGHDEMVDSMIMDLNEERDLANAYFAETDAEKRHSIGHQLNEIYNEMRAD